MSRLLMAYDADCGPCTRFRHFVHRIDLHGEVDFVSLVEADDSGLLDRVPEDERHTAFHVLLSDGRLFTAAAAVPSLLELLPGGRTFSRLLTSMPGGPLLISVVYSGFARGHNGSACRYPRPVAVSRIHRSAPPSVGPSSPGPPRTIYVLAGVIGGLLGSLAMGVAVSLPDALCVHLAAVIAGRASFTNLVAWGIHFLTAASIGSAFGVLASLVPIRDARVLGRGLLLGVTTGAVVWGGFFAPLMLAFLPGLVTTGLLESSFVAHILLGLFLGLTLAVILRATSDPSTST